MIRRTIAVTVTLATVATGVFGLWVAGASAQGYPVPPPVDPPPVVRTLPPTPAPDVADAPGLITLRPQDLTRLSSRELARLSPAVLATLSPEELARLSPQLAQLSPEELVRLSPEEAAQAIELGSTGTNFAPWVLAALFLMVLGTVLVVAGRRRERVSA